MYEIKLMHSDAREAIANQAGHEPLQYFDPADYQVPKIYYRESTSFVCNDSGLNSTMSRDHSRIACRQNALTEKVLLGSAYSQLCGCAIGDEWQAAMRKEGTLQFRSCGRDRSAVARHLGGLVTKFTSPAPSDFKRLILLSRVSFKIGELSHALPFMVAKEEFRDVVRRAGITTAVGWCAIVTDGRVHSIRDEDSVMYPDYRIWLQMLVRKQELVAAETVLMSTYGTDFIVKSTQPGSKEFTPLDANCPPGYTYGPWEDNICHMPSQLFGLSPKRDSISANALFQNMEMKPLIGLPQVEVADALRRHGMLDPLFLVGVRMVLVDGNYSFVDEECPNTAATDLVRISTAS